MDAMRRMELFEIHDQRWFPALLRDLVTDALQALWDFSNSYKPIVPLLLNALSRTGTSEIVDLCSGGGGPWSRLVLDLEREQQGAIRVRLTDKYPNREAFERARCSASESGIAFEERRIEATKVPSDLSGFRTIFSSFHHLGTEEAHEVLADAVEGRTGIAIFEMARREPRIILAICLLPLAILLLTPRMRPFRWSRLLWTYLVPVVPFVLWFDGWMSCLRSYSQQELSELVSELPQEHYCWQWGTQGGGFLPVTYLIGYPVTN